MRKLALAVRVAAPVGWLGAVIGFLAVGTAGLNSQDAATVRGAYLLID